jgi:transcriptional regulator with XRE-family HTH domain
MDDLKEILANNLAKLMELSADVKSQNALAKRSKVAQTTIGNYLNPSSYKGYPQLGKVEQLANAFGLCAWNLLHPTMGDKEFSEKEIQLYRKLRETLKAPQ